MCSNSLWHSSLGQTFSRAHGLEGMGDDDDGDDDDDDDDNDVHDDGSGADTVHPPRQDRLALRGPSLVANW